MATAEMTTGERIQDRRTALRMSTAELADFVGVDKSTITRYEAGTTVRIKQGVLDRIAKALKCSTAWLTGKTENPEPEADVFYFNPEDKKEISKIMERTLSLLHQDGLTLDGSPAEIQALRTLQTGLMISLETARVENKENQDVG